MRQRVLQVPLERGGETLGALMHDLGGFTHSMARGLLDAGCVSIAERIVNHPAEKIPSGTRILVHFDPHTRYKPRPRPLQQEGFRILYEDRDVVVVDKEAGLLTVPTPDSASDSLAELLFASLVERGLRKPALYAVHRLDRDVSGLLVFARSFESLSGLVPQFDAHVAERRYIAVVEGDPGTSEGTERTRLVEDARGRRVRPASDPEDGKHAVTHWRLRERYSGASLLSVQLETGRKNQIRVHLATRAVPIVGDSRYGHESPLIGRVALHAEMLEFEHPVHGGRVRFHSPLPDDMRRLIHHLRSRGTLGDTRLKHMPADAPIPEWPEDAPGAILPPAKGFSAEISQWRAHDSGTPLLPPPSPPRLPGPGRARDERREGRPRTGKELLRGRWARGPRPGAPPEEPPDSTADDPVPRDGPRAARPDASARNLEQRRNPRAQAVRGAGPGEGAKASYDPRRARAQGRPSRDDRSVPAGPEAGFKSGTRARADARPKPEGRPKAETSAKAEPREKPSARAAPKAAWLKKKQAIRVDPRIPDWAKDKQGVKKPRRPRS